MDELAWASVQVRDARMKGERKEKGERRGHAGPEQKGEVWYMDVRLRSYAHVRRNGTIIGEATGRKPRGGGCREGIPNQE